MQIARDWTRTSTPASRPSHDRERPGEERLAGTPAAYQSVTRFVSGINLRAAGVLLGAQLLLVIGMWGFSVDDAWIISRVASHGARFSHFEFNRGQPSDAITPLGFAHLVGWLGIGLGQTEPLQLFAVARCVGVVCELLSWVVVGLALRERRVGVLAAAGLASWPCALWAAAGLETPVVGLLLSWACVVGSTHRRVAGFCLGAASAWRPELSPYCLAMYVLLGGRLRMRSGLWQVAWFCLPHLLVMGVRLALYGSVLPLSFVAKSPEFSSGLRYVLVCVVWGGLLSGALLLPGAFGRGAIGWALLSQLAALLLCGGDWMPGLRLCAPIYPSLVWGVLQTVPMRAGFRGRVQLLLFALMPVMPGYLLAVQAHDFRSVTLRRLDWLKQAAPALHGATTVAAVDVGWVGLAFSGQVLDLGGVTDARLARIPWGHTHRRVGPGLFSDRNVDAWVIRAADRLYHPGQPLSEINAVYGTDARLLARSVDLGLRGVLTFPIEGTPGQYVIARLSDASAPSAPP